MSELRPLRISEKLELSPEQLSSIEALTSEQSESYALVLSQIKEGMNKFTSSQDLEPHLQNILEITSTKFNPTIKDNFVNTTTNQFLGENAEPEEKVFFSNYLLERVFSRVEREIEESVTLQFFQTHKHSEPLRAKTIVAPQGAGKSTMIKSIQNAIAEAKKNPVEDKDLLNLISVVDKLSIITTGTGGIFNPSGEKDYELYTPLKDYCGPIVGAGLLLSDSLTHSLMLLEITRRALDGKTNVMIDTYPRTRGQYIKFFNFVDKLKNRDKGKDHAMYYVMLDLLDENSINQYKYNPQEVEEASTELSEDLKGVLKKVGDLQIQVNATLETQKKQARILFSSLIIKVANLIPDSYSPNPAVKHFKSTQAIGLIRVLERMQGRILGVDNVKDIRGDERKAKSIISRLKDFIALTLPIATSFGSVEILSADRAPQVVVTDLLHDICNKHGISMDSKEVQQFIAMAGMKAKEIVERAQKK